MEGAKEKLTLKGFMVQVGSTFVIAYITTLAGYVYAWPSYTLENFKSNGTVLSHPMSSLEVSVLGSLTNIGALVATPFCGYAVNTVGRKYAALLYGIPFILAWTAISLTNDVNLVLASIGLAGFGVAGQAICTVYISEIAQDAIRGGLTSTTVSGSYFGLLVSYSLGGYLSYKAVVYGHLALSVLFVVMLMMLKESPVYLVLKGRLMEAARSIAFYRQVDVNSKEVEEAINKIKLQLDPRLDKGYKNEEAPATEALVGKAGIQSLSSWQCLKSSQSSRRALYTVLVLMALNILMGAIVLQVYAEPLFKVATPNMPSNLCAILLAVDLMVSSIVCAVLVDKFGRKTLMTWTSAGSGLFTGLLAIQLQFVFAPEWFSVLLVYGYCFVYNLGASTVPFILSAEVFLPEVRGLCNTLCMACMWVTNFIALMTFNPLVDNFGLIPLFYGFSTISFVAAIFSQLSLPETKGLSADQIQLLFENSSNIKKKTNV